MTWNMFAANFSFSVLFNAVKFANLDEPSLLTLSFYKRNRTIFPWNGEWRGIRRKGFKLIFKMLPFVYQLKEEVKRQII